MIDPNRRAEVHFAPLPGTYTLEHPSGPIPVDWCEVVVPNDQFSHAPEGETFAARIGGRVVPAVYSHRKGRQGHALRVLAPFASELVELVQIGTSRTVVQPGFVPHPSVDGRSLMVRVQGSGGGLRTDLVRESAAEKVIRAAIGLHSFGGVIGNEPATPDGPHALVLVWATVRSLSPVVDYAIRFSGRDLFGRTLPTWIDFGDGAEVHLMPDSQFAGITVRGSRVEIGSIGLDFACAPTLRLRVCFPPAGDEGPIDEALRRSAALPCAVGWFDAYRQRGKHEEGDQDARWLTLGVAPEGSSEGADRIRALTGIEADGPELTLSAGGELPGIYDPRPLAQNLVTSNSGTQRFGASFSGSIFELTPAEARHALRASASDEELRPIHLYEANGMILRAKDHPDARFHNRRLHWRNTRDKLGLPEEPPKIARYSGRSADDLQHTDDLAIDAFLALFDCPALEETRRQMVEIDALDDALLNGRTNSAARGWGRPALSTANAAWLFDGDETGILAQGTSMATLHAALATWEGKDVPADRPIKPMRTLKGVSSWALTDPRTGLPMRVAAPYEHATCVTGAIALAQVLREQESRMALGLALALVQTCLRWVYWTDDGSPRWPFIVGCFEGDEDGIPLPIAWLIEDDDRINLVTDRGPSWTRWTGAVAFALPYLQDALAVREDLGPAGEHYVGLSIDEDLERTAAMLRDYLDAEDDELDAKGDDELYRMTAVPTSLDEAPLAWRDVGGAT